jgi:hypothetical protein
VLAEGFNINQTQQIPQQKVFNLKPEGSNDQPQKYFTHQRSVAPVPAVVSPELTLPVSYDDLKYYADVPLLDSLGKIRFGKRLFIRSRKLRYTII